MERGFQSLCPKIAPGPVVLKFVKSGEVSGVVLLQIEIGSLEHMDFTCFLLELLSHRIWFAAYSRGFLPYLI